MAAKKKIHFVSCTESQYKSLQEPDSGTLYFLEDVQQIYKGAVLYTKVPDELSRSVLKLQENAHMHTNKSVLDSISSKSVTQWTQSKPKTTVGIGGKITAKATETGTELAWSAILDPSTDNLLKTSQNGLYVPGYTKSEIDEAFTDTQKQLYSDMSGKISGVQAETKAYFDILTGAMGRLTFYVNAETGDDSNAGTSVSVPLKTVAAALNKYPFYSNIRIQLAAGTYDIGTITAENKKIALVGASAANTTLNGRINLTSCTLTLSALTVVADGTTPIVTASTGSHVYGYRANFTSTGGAECLRVTTASQCYLDGSVFTTANDTDTVVRSSGGALVCLGYCTVPGVLRASTTGLINTVNGTIHDTAVESGGIIWVNGTRVAPVEDTGWITKTADFDETVNGNTVTTKVTVTYRKVGAVASMHAVVNRPKGAASIMLTTGGKLTVPTSCAPAYLYHIPETNVRGVQMTANGTTGDQTYFRFDFLTGAEQTDQTYMFDATYFVN